MKSINPYLIFNGNAEEAFTFYQSVFGGELHITRFNEMPGFRFQEERTFWQDRCFVYSLNRTDNDH